MEDIKTEVFISFKNTDFSGNLTEDRQIAQQLYDELHSRGVPTFFSDATLLSLGQSIYKRAIDEALETTKVMVVIATSRDYLESEWVKYEWESFHQDILSGMKKTAQIVPYISPLTREQTPRSLRDFQTFLIGTHDTAAVADFVQKALETTKKHESQMADFSKEEKQHAKSELASKKVRQSLYSSETNREYDRLMVQAKNTHACDMAVLGKIREEFGDRPLWILDIGCAYNFVGKMRFDKMENVHVLGIDISEKCIKYAAEHSDPEKFTFRKVDLEDPFFDEQLRDIMIELGIESFDIMFGALVFHHLKKPITVLKKLRRMISHDGYMVVRGSDDGSVIALNDDGLTKKIVDKCQNTVGFSDRQNGRKLYNQLANAGYRNICLQTFLKDTSNKSIDERDELFFERFSYRINYFQKILAQDPNNQQKRNDYLFMKYALEELEEMFSEHDFWYCEHDFIAYGKAR